MRYGVSLETGVYTVTVSPYGVVTTSVLTDGRWRVSLAPDGVITTTSVWLGAMVIVEVPPFEVRAFGMVAG